MPWGLMDMCLAIQLIGRDARMLPWYKTDFDGVEYFYGENNYYLFRYRHTPNSWSHIVIKAKNPEVAIDKLSKFVKLPPPVIPEVV